MIGSEQLLQDYKNYEEQNKTNGILKSASGITTLSASSNSSYEGSYAVALAVAYFNTKGYDLSRELIIHAYLNKDENSTYVPTNVSHIKQTKTWKTLKNSTKTSGSNKFDYKTSTAEADCYYSIHKFDWKKNKNTKKITITDRYDFTKGDFTGITEYAVGIVRTAHENGEVTWFNVKITLSY